MPVPTIELATTDSRPDAARAALDLARRRCVTLTDAGLPSCWRRHAKGSGELGDQTPAIACRPTIRWPSLRGASSPSLPSARVPVASVDSDERWALSNARCSIRSMYQSIVLRSV